MKSLSAAKALASQLGTKDKNAESFLSAAANDPGKVEREKQEQEYI